MVAGLSKSKLELIGRPWQQIHWGQWVMHIIFRACCDAGAPDGGVLTSKQDCWGCAGSQHARKELGHAICEGQDGCEAADLGQVEPQSRVIQHDWGHIGQTVPCQVEGCISAGIRKSTCAAHRMTTSFACLTRSLPSAVCLLSLKIGLNHDSQLLW